MLKVVVQTRTIALVTANFPPVRHFPLSCEVAMDSFAKDYICTQGGNSINIAVYRVFLDHRSGSSQAESHTHLNGFKVLPFHYYCVLQAAISLFWNWFF